MDNRHNRIFGIDNLTVNVSNESMVKIIPVGSNVGAESVGAMINEISMNNIPKDDFEDLLKGRSYLEFWIEAIDHSRPTDNNRLYTEREFILGMDRVLHRVIKTGGAQPGEYGHPAIDIDSSKSEAENLRAITARCLDFDIAKISHYVVGTETKNGKTYFLIRTHLLNRMIVNDIAMGKMPTFSIRTMGEFPMVDGVLVGKNLLVVTTDAVYLPANTNSKPVGTSFRYVDPTKAKSVDVQFSMKASGFEGIELPNSVFN